MRHATRPLRDEFTALLAVEGDHVIGEGSSLHETIRRIGSHFGA
ncbi:hypothetical protein [Pseudonocardia sp. TRM90224]|nr:hypothetical protein [Pseudonocardia sp. TRM90224]